LAAPLERGVLFKEVCPLRPFDRALLAAYTFFLTLIFLLFSVVMLGWPAPQFLLRDLFYPGRPEVFWLLMVVLVLSGIRLFWVGIHKPGGAGRHVIVAESALGQVRVSLQAIENLVVKVAAQISGVRDVKARIVSVPQGVGIQIRAVVTPDINVPEVSTEMQQRVKERVFEVTGVNVSSVKVFIENISAHKPRVE